LVFFFKKKKRWGSYRGKADEGIVDGGKGTRANAEIRLTTAVDAASVGGDGGDKDYSSPVFGFHVFDYAFDEEEGGAEVYC
jgi:hypothetical protein